jgi:hypothetical protein
MVLLAAVEEANSSSTHIHITSCRRCRRCSRMKRGIIVNSKRQGLHYSNKTKNQFINDFSPLSEAVSRRL